MSTECWGAVAWFMYLARCLAGGVYLGSSNIRCQIWCYSYMYKRCLDECFIDWSKKCNIC
jgi:hypothetical protein